MFKKSTALAVMLATGATLLGGVTAQADSTYSVQQGDTLSHIAAKYDTSVNHLAQTNSLSSPNFILTGQKLTIASETAESNVTTTVPVKQNMPSKTSNTQVESGWTTMEATAYDPQVASGGATSIPTGSGVAANLSRFPKGTQLQLKFSDGHTESRVVNDTGSFAFSNSNQLDISMSNAQALQFGRQQVQVHVLN